MGMQINREPIDKRILEDEEFYEFFLDEAEKSQEPGVLDEDNVSKLMRDSAYIEECYKKYKAEKGTV